MGALAKAWLAAAPCMPPKWHHLAATACLPDQPGFQPEEGLAATLGGEGLGGPCPCPCVNAQGVVRTPRTGRGGSLERQVGCEAAARGPDRAGGGGPG